MALAPLDSAPTRLAVVLDRVGKGGPCGTERRQQEHHRGRDPDADLVQADLPEIGELDEEEAVAEVDRDEREGRGDERDAEALSTQDESIWRTAALLIDGPGEL